MRTCLGACHAGRQRGAMQQRSARARLHQLPPVAMPARQRAHLATSNEILPALIGLSPLVSHIGVLPHGCAVPQQLHWSVTTSGLEALRWR